MSAPSRLQPEFVKGKATSFLESVPFNGQLPMLVDTLRIFRIFGTVPRLANMLRGDANVVSLIVIGSF